MSTWRFLIHISSSFRFKVLSTKTLLICKQWAHGVFSMSPSCNLNFLIQSITLVIFSQAHVPVRSLTGISVGTGTTSYSLISAILPKNKVTPLLMNVCAKNEGNKLQRHLWQLNFPIYSKIKAQWRSILGLIWLHSEALRVVPNTCNCVSTCMFCIFEFTYLLTVILTPKSILLSGHS